jgi:hypothetical protein
LNIVKVAAATTNIPDRIRQEEKEQERDSNQRR